MRTWKPLEQTTRSHCLETCASALLGLDEPFVLPGRHECRWLDLQRVLRAEHNTELRHFPLKVAARTGEPRFGARAWMAFVADPDDGRRHTAIARRDLDGALRIVHDGARPHPADTYEVSHLVNFEPSPRVFAPLEAEARCEDHCQECWWHGY